MASDKVTTDGVRVNPASRSALVLVDVQNGFVNESSAHVVPAAVEVAERWQAAGGTVVATRFHNPDGGNWERLLDWHRLKESPDTDLVPTVAAIDPIVLDKSTYSSVTEEFVAMGKENGWATIVVCGIATDACVLKTAVDVFEHDLTPIVVADACASDRAEEAHEAGLLLLSYLIGAAQIVTRRNLQLDP